MSQGPYAKGRTNQTGKEELPGAISNKPRGHELRGNDLIAGASVSQSSFLTHIDNFQESYRITGSTRRDLDARKLLLFYSGFWLMLSFSFSIRFQLLDTKEVNLYAHSFCQ